MGNYRFRLSDMMPNAWFYKLKDMGSSSSSRSRNQNTTHSAKKKQPISSTSKSKQPHFSQPRKSYYITRDPIIPTTDKFYNSPTNSKSLDIHVPSDPPIKSSNKQQTKRKKPIIKSSSSPKLVTSSVSAGCSCRATIDSVWTKSDSPPDYSVSASPLDSSPEIAAESFDGMVSWSKSCSCSLESNANDIIIDMGSENFTRKFENFDGFEKITKLELPPIITKPAKFNDMITDIKKKEIEHRKSSAKLEETNAHGSLSVKLVKEESTATLKEQRRNSHVKRFSANSQGMKLRVNSPKIASKKIQAHGRKSVSSCSSSSSRRSLSDSFAIVKSSCNPQRDFRDSMVEMIVENNIRASKDLEELLACYLSLNSDEYHDLIIKVFKQIWFDLTDSRTK